MKYRRIPYANIPLCKIGLKIDYNSASFMIVATLGLEESPVERPFSGYIMCQSTSQPADRLDWSFFRKTQNEAS